MISAARMQISQQESEALVQVRATKYIVLADSTESTPTVIGKGEIFTVDMTHYDGVKVTSFVGRYNGESFFVDVNEFEAVYN